MASKQLTVAELIEQLQLLPDKSKWVYVESSGHVTGVDDCPEYDDPEDPDSEDQGTCVNITTYQKVNK